MKFARKKKKEKDSKRIIHCLFPENLFEITIDN